MCHVGSDQLNVGWVWTQRFQSRQSWVTDPAYELDNLPV